MEKDAKKVEEQRLTDASAFKTVPDKQKADLEAFIASIPQTRFFTPDSNPNKEWKLFYGRTMPEALVAAREAANPHADGKWNDEHIAALQASRVAAWYAGRKEAWFLLIKKVGEIAVESTFGDIKDLPVGLPKEAEATAQLVASTILASDLEYNGKAEHEAYAKARWEVLQKGYRLLCDKAGVFYVCATDLTEPPEPRTEQH